MSSQAMQTAVVALVMVVTYSSALALNESTHAIVNEQAFRWSTARTALASQLGLFRGPEHPLGDRTVLEWIREGGIREDSGSLLDGTARYLRHFHDPLRPWDQAGLTLAWLRYESAIRWMQRADQHVELHQPEAEASWGWPRARRELLLGLTAGNPDTREAALANAFRALGQLMHLVVDAAVPEHARDDPHPMEAALRTAGLTGYGNYEHWLSDQQAADESRFVATYLANPVPPDTGLLQAATGDPVASLPIARLVDADVYTGADPNATLAGPVGIAEVANANFFSEDTGSSRLFGPDYPHPRTDGLVPVLGLAPSGTHVRAYYEKAPGDGLPVRPVLAECVFDEAGRAAGLPAGTLVKCTDANVWARVAEAMLPRAAGYAAALLDHFFRGRLEARLDMTWDGTRERLTVQFTNRTPGETMAGTFALHYDTPAGERKAFPEGQWTLVLAPGESSPTFTIPVPTDVGYPWLLVFDGTLGREPGAVASAVVGPTYYLVSLFRADIPASECQTGTRFDRSVVYQLVEQTAAVALYRVNALPVDHALPNYGCAYGAGDIVEPADVDLWRLVYRLLGGLPGRRMTVRSHTSSWPYLGVGCGLFDGVETAWRPPAAEVEVLELEPPATPDAFATYTTRSFPAIRRVLGRLATGETVAFEVGDATLFGFRFVSTPPPPILGPLWDPYYSLGPVTRTDAAWGLCFAQILATFE